MRERAIRAAIALALALLACTATAAAIGLLVAAIFLGLASVLPAAWAALFTAAFALVLAVGLLAGARALLRAPRAAAASQPSGEAETLAAMARLAENIAPLARKHFPLVAGAAFTAGVVLGKSSRARRGLWRTIAGDR